MEGQYLASRRCSEDGSGVVTTCSSSTPGARSIPSPGRPTQQQVVTWVKEAYGQLRTQKVGEVGGGDRTEYPEKILEVYHSFSLYNGRFSLEGAFKRLESSPWGMPTTTPVDKETIPKIKFSVTLSTRKL